MTGVMPSFVAIAGALVFALAPALAQRQMENLTRGVVAVKRSDNKVYISWRLFGMARSVTQGCDSLG